MGYSYARLVSGSIPVAGVPMGGSEPHVGTPWFPGFACEKEMLIP